MYSRKNYDEARAEINKRRTDAIAEAEGRRTELSLMYPSVREIDTELAGTGLVIFRAACQGNDLAPIRERNAELIKKRGELLLSLGYPENYTEPSFTCKDCSDTGFVGTKMCHCLKEVLITKNIQSSGMGRLIDRQSFENFDLDWYKSSEEDYKRAQHNYNTALAFAENFSKNKGGNLLLIGNTGTGKTHLSTAIAKRVISDGFDVLYDTAQNIIQAFADDQFRDRYRQPEPVADKYLECDLLILDDLGAEFTNQLTVSCLYNLINTRQNKGLSTIISTNLSAKELAGKYEGRIYSRIVGSDYTVLFFSGKDHRIG